MPERSLNELAEKIQKLTGEVEALEYRIKNLRIHITDIEGSLEKIKVELLDGFHKINKRLSNLEEDIKKLMEEKVKGGN